MPVVRHDAFNLSVRLESNFTSIKSVSRKQPKSKAAPTSPLRRRFSLIAIHLQAAIVKNGSDADLSLEKLSPQANLPSSVSVGAHIARFQRSLGTYEFSYFGSYQTSYVARPFWPEKPLCKRLFFLTLSSETELNGRQSS